MSRPAVSRPEMSHPALSRPEVRHPGIRHSHMFHPNIRGDISHQEKVCHPEIRHPDIGHSHLSESSLAQVSDDRWPLARDRFERKRRPRQATNSVASLSSLRCCPSFADVTTKVAPRGERPQGVVSGFRPFCYVGGYSARRRPRARGVRGAGPGTWGDVLPWSIWSI